MRGRIYISTLISNRSQWSKHCFEVSAEGGLSKVAGGQSLRGGGDRASGSIGT
jgi:hypothetical protein